MKDNALLQIALICLSLSLLAFGGGKSLIPELHKDKELKKGLLQTLMFVIGIGLMMGLLIFE